MVKEMKRSEMNEIIAENPECEHIEVTEVDGKFHAKINDTTYVAGNPFGLDSLLDLAGHPRPRNLYLIDEED